MNIYLQKKNLSLINLLHMKKLFYNQKELNIFLNKISNLGELLKSYQDKNKYFEVLNKKKFQNAN